MSQAAHQTQPPKPAAAGGAAANDNAPWPTDGEIRIRMLKFVTANLPISNVNAVNDKLVARAADTINGVDLYYSPAARHYRFVRVERGLTIKQLIMHESRVDFAEPW